MRNWSWEFKFPSRIELSRYGIHPTIQIDAVEGFSGGINRSPLRTSAAEEFVYSATNHETKANWLVTTLRDGVAHASKTRREREPATGVATRASSGRPWVRDAGVGPNSRAGPRHPGIV